MIWITITMTITAMMMFVAFARGIEKRYGIIPSFSDSIRTIKKENRWLFRAVLFSSGIALLLNGVFFSSIPLIASGPLIFLVGIFDISSNNKTIKSLHGICAFGGFFIAMFAFHWTILLIIATAITITILNSLKYDKNVIVWNTEMVLVGGIFLGIIELFVRYFNG